VKQADFWVRMVEQGLIWTLFGGRVFCTKSMLKTF